MDRERIEHLIEILKSSTAQELAVDDGTQMVRIRRGAGEVGGGASSTAQMAPALVGDAMTEQVTTAVRANQVGLFYRGKEAGTAPLVEVGDHVEERQVVGTIDALRRLTEVRSPTAGEVVEIAAQDGQAVQYGQILMLLKPSEREAL